MSESEKAKRAAARGLSRDRRTARMACSSWCSMIDLLLVMLQELSWTPTAFPPRPSARSCKKLLRFRLVGSFLLGFQLQRHLDAAEVGRQLHHADLLREVVHQAHLLAV